MAADRRICTDSSAQLPAGLASALGVTVVPVPVTVDGVAFEEGIDLDPDWFYERLGAGGQATTSQPNPARFTRAYEAAAAGGCTELLSLHLDARASGTFEAARAGARGAPAQVTVIDTRTASFGVGICVLEAAAALGAGGSQQDAVAQVAELASRIGNVFVAAGIPGGRVPPESGVPVFTFADGAVRLLARAKDGRNAARRMAAHVLARPGRLRVAVGHAAASTEEDADLLAGTIARGPAVAEVLRYRVGPSVGAHTGPLSFGAFWWPAAA